MGIRKALASQRWAWIAGLTFVALLAVPVGTSGAVEVESDDDILIFVAHPDDDIITAAGVTMDHLDNGTGDVTIAFMTNGDRCESQSQVDAGRCSSLQPGIGTTRQVESVAAQGILGVSESDVIFLGYPNGFVDLVRFNNQGAFPVLAHTETYASHGLGGTDWHDYRMGGGSQHVAYPSSTMAQDLLADVAALVSTYKPDHIFTHTRWDRHEDHFSTYYMLIDAVKVVQDSDPSYDPYIHTTIVHVKHADHINLWPATANPATPVNEYVELEGDSGGELVWDQRESFEVPATMQTGYFSGTNEKAEAIEAHASQVADGGYFIRRFAHQDEVFWVERVGEAEGIADSYVVVEGGALAVGGSGVLRNDVRGIAPVGNAPGVNPDPLGPMVAELVSGPSHADSFALNSDGSFDYTHDDTETTSDSFVYRPVQGSTDGITTTVTITIDPENDAPTATPDSYEVDRGELITVPAAGVLGNDSDPEGDALTAIEVSGPSNGSLTLSSDGAFTYAHDGSATPSDSFSYMARDGQYNSAPVIVSITVNSSDPLAASVEGASTGVTGLGYPFSATVSGGTGTKSYSWQAKRDGIVVDSSAAPTFTFSSNDAGKYSIELTVTDTTGSVVDTQVLTLLGDIAASPFASDIIWLADEGITQGCNPPQNDMFCPNDRVTRGQMAAFLVRFLGLSSIDPEVEFGDIGGSVFETNILKLATAGITKGCNPPVNDMFCPNDYVTRGQMAAFLVRALGLTDDGGGDLFIDDNGSVFEANIDRLATAGITRGCNAAGDEFCPNSLVTRGQMAAFLHRADGLSG